MVCPGAAGVAAAGHMKNDTVGVSTREAAIKWNYTLISADHLLPINGLLLWTGQ